MARELTSLDRSFEHQAEPEHELDQLVRSLDNQPRQIIINRPLLQTIRQSSMSKPRFSSNVIGR